MTQNYFSTTVVVSSRRSTQREINELTVRMSMASAGGALSPPSFPSLKSALRQVEGDGLPQAERADLVRM